MLHKATPPGGTLRRLLVLSAALAAGMLGVTGGTAQAAGADRVPCSTAALSAAIAAANTAGLGDLSLARHCTYVLAAPLQAVDASLTIAGHGATLERSHVPGTPAFTILRMTSPSANVTGLP